MAYEIDAQKVQTGQRIIERFLDDGTRFIKHIPYNPLIYAKLQEQFKNRNVILEISESKWIRIKRTGEVPDFKKAAEQVTGKSEITTDDIMNAEVDILRKGGFVVKVKKIEE